MVTTPWNSEEVEGNQRQLKLQLTTCNYQKKFFAFSNLTKAKKGLKILGFNLTPSISADQSHLGRYAAV